MKKFRNTFDFALIAALCLAIAGCGKQPKGNIEPNPIDHTRTVTITDMGGNTVTINGEVKRIVNLWPSVTAGLFSLGAGDLIVGMTIPGPSLGAWSHFLYPNSVNIPGLGGGATPTVEDLIKWDPDLVICAASSASTGFPQQLNAVGIPAIVLKLDSYEQMKEGWSILGEILGGEYQKKIRDWCDEVDTRLANVRKLTAGIADTDRPVVFQNSHGALITTTWGMNSPQADSIESAGGIFASRRLQLKGADVTAEAIFALNPDVILFGGNSTAHVYKYTAENTPGWQDLNAVKNGRVYINPSGFHSWECFGVECLLQINYALFRIHPEIAAANGINYETLIDELIAFYGKYAGVQMTRQVAGYMFDGLNPDGTMENPPPASSRG